MVIRRVLIEKGTRLKKERGKHILTMVDKIHDLETAHKCSPNNTDPAELIAGREALKCLYFHQVIVCATRCWAKYYAEGNKCGKFFAKALQDQRTRAYSVSQLLLINRGLVLL